MLCNSKISFHFFIFWKCILKICNNCLFVHLHMRTIWIRISFSSSHMLSLPLPSSLLKLQYLQLDNTSVDFSFIETSAPWSNYPLPGSQTHYPYQNKCIHLHWWSHLELKSCLHLVAHSDCSTFDMLGTCISHQSISHDSQTFSWRWSS